MSLAEYKLEIKNNVQLSKISRVNDTRISFNANTQEANSFKNSIVKKVSIAGMVMFSSMSSAVVYSEATTNPSIELKQNLQNENHNGFDFTRTQTPIVQSAPSYTLNKTIDIMGFIEELGADRVDRISIDYHPKVKKIAKPVKKSELNFNKSVENVREIYY